MRRAGFVLAGGQSSRMGRDKALLPWAGRTLIEHIAGLVRDAAGSVCLVGAPERYRDLPFPCIADQHPGCGPLSGLEAALASDSAAELNLVLACDLPAVDGPLLSSLFTEAQTGNRRCVVAQGADGRLQPLCAVYRDCCLEVVRRRLLKGEWRMMDLMPELQAQRFPVAFSLGNVNTPEEWAAWQST